MKIGSSETWREHGASQAFDHGAWEFRSRQFCSSARQLLHVHDAQLAAPSFDSIMCLPTAVFLLSLAIEQVCKAYYLKSGAGPKEAIYSHEVASLCGDKLLNAEQRDLMTYAEGFVVWAGRYPTPKWTKEIFKEAYDVPSAFVDGTEHIDATKMPNAASRERANQLLSLCEHIRTAWAQTKDA
jgi:hypothetical protein